LRGYFSRCKADDEGRLPPGKEDNAAARKIDRKGGVVLELIDYISPCPYSMQEVLYKCIRLV